MNSHGFPFKLSACAIAVLISACGGGSSTAPILVPGSTGFAVDDYIKDANVLCDTNGNGVSDAGEATTKTDSSGFFKFQPLCASTIVVSGGTNIDTNLPFVGKLKAPAGATVVTPLTTLLAEGMSNEQIISAMGLPAGTNVLAIDPARKVDGKLEQAALFKKTLAMQQLLQKTAETLAALIPGGNASALYADVAAAMAATLRTSPNLISGGTFSQSAIASLVQASATRLQSSLGAGVNAASLGAVVAGALKVQGDRILGASDSTLTATVLTEQSSSAIKNFVNTNKSALGSPPSGTTDTLGSQLTQEVTGKEPPPPAPPVEPPAGSTSLASFDEATLPMVTEFGGAGYAIGTGPDGGSGKSLKIARNGGETYAGAWVKIPAIAANTGSRTIWARVYSPVPVPKFVAKVEFGDNQGSGNIQANEAVVAGWQTLTWTVNTDAFDATKVYDRFTVLPNLDTVDSSKDYYIDSISLLAPPPAPCSTAQLQCLAFSESTAGVSGFGNLVTSEISDDPVAGSSNKVVRLVKGVAGTDGRQPWAGATVRTSRTGTDPNFVDTVDRVGLGTSKVVTLRSYSSAPIGTKITLKLENGINPNQYVIAEAVTTAVNSWETLSFNFENPTNGTYDAAVTYNKASILPGWTEVGGTSSLTAEATFYFDELKYSVYSAPAPAPSPSPSPSPSPAPSATTITFDSGGANYQIGGTSDFGGNVSSLENSPPSGATGAVAKVVKPSGAQTWAGTTFLKLTGQEIVSASSRTVSVKVHAPAGKVIRLKLEQDGDNTKSVEMDQTTLVSGWQTLTFNTNSPADGTAAYVEGTTYDKASLFFNFNVSPVSEEVYYFDEFSYTPATLGGSGSGGLLTFSGGFAANSLTPQGGRYYASSGSNATDWSCPADPNVCGTGGAFDGSATSSIYHYFQYASSAATPTGLYVNINVFGPSVTDFSTTGDTGGLTLSGQTKVNFKFNSNPEWFSSTTKNFLVMLELGKLYKVGPGQTQDCRIQLRQVVVPTSDAATSYSLNLSEFAVVQPCETAHNTATAALTNGGPVSLVKFEAAGGASSLTANGRASGANLSVTAGSVIPTTVAITGPITFD